MLRRKLLTRVGLLICAFVLGAAGAVWALQKVLADIDHANADAAFLIDGIQSVATAVNAVESSRFSVTPTLPGAPATDDPSHHLADVIGRLARHPITAPGQKAAADYQQLCDALPAFLSAWSGPAVEPGSPPDAPALAASLEVQSRVQQLGRTFRDEVAREQVQVGRNFRTIVLILTLAALVMVNVAVFVLLRTAQMVLKPVGALVSGSRELAAERFDHRVSIPQLDEFGELAHAYNRLAEHLQANEERKAETLRQLAVTLNHDLNNAMSIIELQLGLLDRQAGANPTQSKHLREIRASLSRMTQIVASLKNIRRVVLTDYGPGQKMVDLERSVADEHVRPDPLAKSA
ncbi:Signal transduction histidine-protein kinase BaeS [Phycisphaerales bacterium]|nr:Signal transduction histidine-protein kinase BaeS [Phycisphaerales bacterium]